MKLLIYDLVMCFYVCIIFSDGPFEFGCCTLNVPPDTLKVVIVFKVVIEIFLMIFLLTNFALFSLLFFDTVSWLTRMA